MSELSDVLHVLRNPWGHGEEAIRAVQLKAADLLESAAPVPAREWISVGERLPDPSLVEVLSWTPVGAAVIFAECLEYLPNPATHWMPLPPPPAADK